MKAWLPIVFLVALTPRAFADDAAAKALFDQGKTLYAEGKYGEACAKLEASFKLNPLSGTRGLLGACFEKIGRLASAWAAFRDAATMAERQGNAERAQASRDKAAELEPKLARVTIDAKAIAKVPNVQLSIDGTPYPLALGALDAPLPVDAGQHLVAVTATDHKPWRATIDIEDGEEQSLTVPALVEDHSARIAEDGRRDAIRSTIRRRKLLAYGVGGGGIAMLGVSAGLAIVARGQWNDAKAMGCPEGGGVCESESAAALARGASTKATYATYFGLAGLALAGAGAAIYLTSPSERALIVPTVSPSGAGVLLQGQF